MQPESEAEQTPAESDAVEPNFWVRLLHAASTTSVHTGETLHQLLIEDGFGSFEELLRLSPEAADGTEDPNNTYADYAVDKLTHVGVANLLTGLARVVSDSTTDNSFTAKRCTHAVLSFGLRVILRFTSKCEGLAPEGSDGWPYVVAFMMAYDLLLQYGHFKPCSSQIYSSITDQEAIAFKIIDHARKVSTSVRRCFCDHLKVVDYHEQFCRTALATATNNNNYKKRKVMDEATELEHQREEENDGEQHAIENAACLHQQDSLHASLDTTSSPEPPHLPPLSQDSLEEAQQLSCQILQQSSVQDLTDVCRISNQIVSLLYEAERSCGKLGVEETVHLLTQAHARNDETQEDENHHVLDSSDMSSQVTFNEVVVCHVVNYLLCQMNDAQEREEWGKRVDSTAFLIEVCVHSFLLPLCRDLGAVDTNTEELTWKSHEDCFTTSKPNAPSRLLRITAASVASVVPDVCIHALLLPLTLGIFDRSDNEATESQEEKFWSSRRVLLSQAEFDLITHVLQDIPNGHNMCSCDNRRSTLGSHPSERPLSPEHIASFIEGLCTSARFSWSCEYQLHILTMCINSPSSAKHERPPLTEQTVASIAYQLHTVSNSNDDMTQSVKFATLFSSFVIRFGAELAGLTMESLPLALQRQGAMQDSEDSSDCSTNHQVLVHLLLDAASHLKSFLARSITTSLQKLDV